MRYTILVKQDNVSKSIKEKLINSIKHEYNQENPELVIAVGGDGTILKSVHQYPKAIIFGLHTGHLGFYSNYCIENLEQLIEDINSGSYRIEYLDQLKCTIHSKDTLIEQYALNEMVIMMPPRTLILDLAIDGKNFERFRGTGFCISTPFGSTAYNKSLHGAVVDPEVKVFQIAEIAGINSNAYRTLSSPLVLSCKREVTFSSLEQQSVYITIDQDSYELEDFICASITYANNMVKMAYHEEKTFFTDRIRRTFLKD